MRTSRKQVNRLAKCLNMRLAIHERLGDRNKSYYEYSIVNIDKNNNYIDTVLSCVSLKECYEYLINLFNKEI